MLARPGRHRPRVRADGHSVRAASGRPESSGRTAARRPAARPGAAATGPRVRVRSWSWGKPLLQFLDLLANDGQFPAVGAPTPGPAALANPGRGLPAFRTGPPDRLQGLTLHFGERFQASPAEAAVGRVRLALAPPQPAVQRAARD